NEPAHNLPGSNSSHRFISSRPLAVAGKAKAFSETTKQFTERKFMNTSLNEPPTTELHQQRPAIQKASEPADAVVADEVSFVKKHRRLLLATGLTAGGLEVAMMGGGAKPAAKDPNV